MPRPTHAPGNYPADRAGDLKIQREDAAFRRMMQAHRRAQVARDTPAPVTSLKGLATRGRAVIGRRGR